MESRSVPKHDFPMRFSLKGRSVTLRPLAAEDARQMIAFAGGLSEDDLLFLFLDGSRLCSSCYETRYNELGTG